METCSGFSPDWYTHGSFTLGTFRWWLGTFPAAGPDLECKTDTSDSGGGGGSERPGRFPPWSSTGSRMGRGNEPKVWRQKSEAGSSDLLLAVLNDFVDSSGYCMDTAWITMQYSDYQCGLCSWRMWVHSGSDTFFHGNMGKHFDLPLFLFPYL